MTRRLLADAGAARGYLAGSALAGLIVTVLILAQAGLLARTLAAAAPGTGAGVLRWTLIAPDPLSLTSDRPYWNS